ncbi:hypothetical protein E2C01_016102 [Portunus trituberculatus]|uniref:Uncharacterized protein n=1 Tax=Portunus trituberculatus TaxID=210409 RepID=A0A5B7DPV2_PORTR|nr:hypothetical protein [Portunus trituberculatus]
MTHQVSQVNILGQAGGSGGGVGVKMEGNQHLSSPCLLLSLPGIFPVLGPLYHIPGYPYLACVGYKDIIL